jgi:rRNA maturation RNase YbeY
MSDVSFHSEQTDFYLLSESQITDWLSLVCQKEGKVLSEISIIFCSDDYLLDVNKKHLNHDYYTDVITFDYTEGNMVSGDVFISVDRVSENAESFSASVLDEVHRIIVHGTLHLLGYTDGEGIAKEEMTAKENFYLSLRAF